MKTLQSKTKGTSPKVTYEVGNILSFDTPYQILWAVIKQHPDKPLVFLVPLDDVPMTGPCDVKVSDGALNLRGNKGLWVSSEGLKKGSYRGTLEESDLEKILTTLSDMVTGALNPTEEALDTEDHPDYEDWEETLERASHALLYLIQDFKTDWTTHIGETIQDVLEEREMSFKEFTEAMQVHPDTLSRMIQYGDVPITYEIAERLANVLGSTPQFWKHSSKL